MASETVAMRRRSDARARGLVVARSVALVVSAVAAPVVLAQPAPTGTGRIVGTVYDSLFARGPLSDADVWIDGLPGLQRTDARGQFELRGLAPGRYRLAFGHASLEAIGVEPPTITVAVVDAAPITVRLATPSPATLAPLLCGRGAPPDQRSLIVGLAREVGSDAPVPLAQVSAAWNQLHFVDGRMALVRPDVPGRVLDGGGYVICRVPGDAEVQLTARTADGRIAVVPYAMNSQLVGARLLPLAQLPTPGAAARGVVLSSSGAPIAGARVFAADDTIGVRTDATGVFTLRTREATLPSLTIRALGHAPVVWPGSTTPASALTITMDGIGDVLAAIEVREKGPPSEAPPEFDRRRTQGMGKYFTRADIERLQPVETAHLLQQVAGWVVRPNGEVVSARSPATGTCAPVVYLNGLPFATETRGFAPLLMISPDMVAGMEIYSSAMAPIEYPGRCGSIVIWTRSGGRRNASR